MPRSPNGTYSKPAGTTAVTNATVESAAYNDLADDMATAIERTLDRAGTAPMTANFSLGNFKVTGLAAGTTAGDMLRVDQGLASGTLMIFAQTAAPTGWTKGTTHNNKALRLVSGTASTGGSTAFTSVFAARTIATANMPASHTHTFSATSGASGTLAVSFNRTSWTYDSSQNTDGFNGDGGSNAETSMSRSNDNISGTAASHTHLVSGSTDAQGSGTALDFDVQYMDVIIATKD